MRQITQRIPSYISPPQDPPIQVLARLPSPSHSPNKFTTLRARRRERERERWKQRGRKGSDRCRDEDVRGRFRFTARLHSSRYSIDSELSHALFLIVQMMTSDADWCSPHKRACPPPTPLPASPTTISVRRIAYSSAESEQTRARKALVMEKKKSDGNIQPRSLIRRRNRKTNGRKREEDY